MTLVAIDEINFPDATFREYVRTNFDKDKDDNLSETEIINVSKIDVDGKEITDLTGVENFIKLRILYCRNTGITELDVSGNTELKYLWCNNTKITELDVSNNTALEYLSCYSTGITDDFESLACHICKTMLNLLSGVAIIF